MTVLFPFHRVSSKFWIRECCVFRAQSAAPLPEENPGLGLKVGDNGVFFRRSTRNLQGSSSSGSIGLCSKNTGSSSIFPRISTVWRTSSPPRLSKGRVRSALFRKTAKPGCCTTCRSGRRGSFLLQKVIFPVILE